MEDNEEFTSLGRAIAGLRKQRGLTQKTAADLVGMSQRSWQDWELDKADAVPHIPKIEEALGVPPDYFRAQLSVLGRLFVFEARVIAMSEELKGINKKLDILQYLLEARS